MNSGSLRIWLMWWLLPGVAISGVPDAGPGPDLPANPPAAAMRIDPKLPSLFVASDSTAAKTSDSSAQGWAEPFKTYFDPEKINVLNQARGGRSSRTFITEGLWAQLVEQVKAGDIVLIQFGHNDATAIDSPQARGALPGLGEETQTVHNAVTGKEEVVHTTGWYLRKMIADTREKRATPILVSLTLHNSWRDGGIERGPGEYARWFGELAKAEGIPFVDLSALEADTFQAMGQEKVAKLYRGKTHFGPEAADLHARFVVAGLGALPGKPVADFLSPAGRAAVGKPAGNLPE